MAKNFSKTIRQQNFLLSIPKSSIKDSDILTRSKFNFSYLDKNPPGQDFVDWNIASGDSKLVKLINKLKEYTREPLSYWRNLKIGKGIKGGIGKRQNCLEIYKNFPTDSAFKHPSNVPEDVWWGRFRIDSGTRLCGFVIPDDINNGNNYDVNTFYVVFLDDKHQFYQTNKK